MVFDDASDWIALFALILSILNFVLNQSLEYFFYGPYCRLIVNSISKGFDIQLENVGGRVMHVDRILFSVKKDRNDNHIFTNDLSSLFYSIPCETRAEARLEDVVLFPNSKHHLLTTTFFTQEDLLKAWDIIKNLTIKVEYKGLFRQYFPTVRNLKPDYKAFRSAISDGKNGIRKLKAFEKEE